MSSSDLDIKFSTLGIGQVLNQNNLAVPVNQRSYAWERKHVETLLQDLAGAMAAPDESIYFLGTIVLTHGSGDRLEVSDGQQRLATISILIAAIRDYLSNRSNGEKQAANKYTSKYLLEYDEHEGDYIPKLKMNYRDNELFKRNVLHPLEDTKVECIYSSHDRIMEAKQVVQDYVQKIVAPFGESEKSKALYKWVEFVTSRAIVIVIKAPNSINAYKMFETLNDRGLKASQVDILKNFLFGTAAKRLDEIQSKWDAMINVIQNIGDDELTLNHIRHSWIAKNGPTVERDLAKSIQDTIGNMQQAIDIVSYFESSANYYVALLTPLEHPIWTKYGQTTRYHIHIITQVLKIEQIRPLMLAIAFNFCEDEAKKAFKLLLSISVRFLIYGISGSGGLEKNYGTLAKEISDGIITKTDQIIPKMTVNVPTDQAFEDAFKVNNVTKIALARYYLRAIEAYKRKEPNPEYGGVDDTIRYTLEHIMPLKLTAEWKISPEIASAYQRRLGNMVLLNPAVNVEIGNGSFPEKKKVFKDQTILTTQEISKITGLDWGSTQINERQIQLASVAPRIWSIKA
ncbi:MAG: DUF262 domain-containing protein [Syntrophorhabdaceae bacterium]|nr:DUF262 domain-containing protein [Syntrophorhabdaceae bacterium]